MMKWMEQFIKALHLKPFKNMKSAGDSWLVSGGSFIKHDNSGFACQYGQTPVEPRDLA